MNPFQHARRGVSSSRVAARLLALLLLLPIGCAAPRPATQPAETGHLEPGAGDQQRQPEPEPQYRPFASETLYDLLVAEFAARRGRPDITLRNYLEQAQRTRDPGVAERAARLARYMNASDAALVASLIWAETAPRSAEARYAAAVELARAGRVIEAAQQMRALHELGGKGNFTAIAAGALEMDEALKRSLLHVLESIDAAQDTDLLGARAILLQSMNENDAAMRLVREILELEPDNYGAVLIEAQIYQNRGDTDTALARMAQALAAQPGKRQLRTQYARLLAKSRPQEAEQQFRVLLDSEPGDGESRLMLAMLYRDREDWEAMRRELRTLLEQDQYADAAHFYLAQDAERRSSWEEAVELYLQVKPSSLFAEALNRAGELIIRHRGIEELATTMASLRLRWPEQSVPLVVLESDMRSDADDLPGAEQLLDDMLRASPAEPALLYARSMVREKRRNLAGLEQDLREMLRLDPDSALALNALGYSLCNMSERYDEALALISRALELKPEDPAILDSMGWVQYRLGNLDEALRHLQHAFSLYPDHEVAAHLGEVLWKLDRQQEAREAWEKGLSAHPDSPLVLETMRRLGVESPPPADTD